MFSGRAVAGPDGLTAPRGLGLPVRSRERSSSVVPVVVNALDTPAPPAPRPYASAACLLEACAALHQDDLTDGGAFGAGATRNASVVASRGGACTP